MNNTDGYWLIEPDENGYGGEWIDENGEIFTDADAAFFIWAQDQVDEKLEHEDDLAQIDIEKLLLECENDPTIMTGSINNKTGKVWTQK